MTARHRPTYRYKVTVPIRVAGPRRHITTYTFTLRGARKLARQELDRAWSGYASDRTLATIGKWDRAKGAFVAQERWEKAEWEGPMVKVDVRRFAGVGA